MAITLNPKLLPAALALGLLALGIPQTGDSILWVLTGDSPDQIGADSPISAAKATRNAMLLESTDDWFGDPKARIRAGILRLRLATKSAGGAANAINRSDLERALGDLKNGLGRAPANSIGWTALSQAHLAAGEPTLAHASLTASLLLDDHNPQLSLWRCALGLELWSYLNDDDRRMWIDQVDMAWHENPQALVTLGHQYHGKYLQAIRLALLPNRPQLEEFDRLFDAGR